MGANQINGAKDSVSGHCVPAVSVEENYSTTKQHSSSEVSMKRPISVRSRWLWIRSFGAILALAPGVVFMTAAVMASEDMEVVTPFLHYLLVSSVALLVGYLFMRKGMAEEERDRIRAIVREVLDERSTQVTPPGIRLTPPTTKRVSPDDVARALGATDSKVTQLPFMENDDASR